MDIYDKTTLKPWWACPHQISLVHISFKKMAATRININLQKMAIPKGLDY